VRRRAATASARRCGDRPARASFPACSGT
jgi:hypothetical protein